MITAVLASEGVSLSADGLIALRRIATRSATDPVLAALPGGFSTRRKGTGQEVADTREYVIGDDIRHLDRGATARTGKLHVRQFQEERDRVVFLVADFRPSMLWGISRKFRSVVAAEILALIGWRAVEDGARVGLVAVSEGDPVIVAPRGRTRGMLNTIGGLVGAHQDALSLALQGRNEDPPLNMLLDRLRRICPAGSEILIASGFDNMGDGLCDLLDNLAQRCTPRFLHVTDADPRNLPRGQYPIRLPGGRRVRLALSGAQLAEASDQAPGICGRMAVQIDAGQPMEQIARMIGASLPAGHGR